MITLCKEYIKEGKCVGLTCLRQMISNILDFLMHSEPSPFVNNPFGGMCQSWFLNTYLAYDFSIKRINDNEERTIKPCWMCLQPWSTCNNNPCPSKMTSWLHILEFRGHSWSVSYECEIYNTKSLLSFFLKMYITTWETFCVQKEILALETEVKVTQLCPTVCDPWIVHV